MFKKGDRVRYIGYKESHRNECGKLTRLKHVGTQGNIWNLEFNHFWLQEMEVKEDEIELIISKPEKYRSCECGAWAQRGFENMHSDWCPMYKRNK